MCDYSLHSVKNRLAVEGESLFVHKFHTGSKGLASVEDFAAHRVHWIKRFLNRVFTAPYWAEIRETDRKLTAVCIPPGARLRLSGIPLGTRQELGVSDVEDVVFYQNLDSPGYRDMFKFANGRTWLLQLFHEGLRVEVLSLELGEQAAAGISYKQALGRSQRVNA